MSSNFNPNQGLRNNARSPGSIDNAEHHDPSGSKKVIPGIPGTIDSIFATSSSKNPIPPASELWVVNTDAAIQYVYIGKDSGCPAGAPSITTGIAIPAGKGFAIHCGVSDDPMQSIVVKTSSNNVQVTLLQS